MTSLIDCLFNAPLVAVDEADLYVFHAVTMDGVADGWEFTDAGEVAADLAFVSVCGLAGLKVCGHDGLPVLWPPNANFLPKPYTRCLRCHRATGRKSPRSVFKAKEPA